MKQVSEMPTSGQFVAVWQIDGIAVSVDILPALKHGDSYCG